MWFRRAGVGAWLVVGMVLVLAAAAWLLGKTATIVEPLIAGFVFAAIAGLFVDRLEARGWPRAAGAGLLVVLVIALSVLVVVLVLAGISSQSDQISASMSHALQKVQDWAQARGLHSASTATDQIKHDVPAAGHTLLTGVIHGISGFASLLVFLGFTAFATFFLVKDAPALGRWIEGHMGLPPWQARIVMRDIIHALRRYFLGLTIIAGISTAGVVIGSLIVGLPLLGTIAIITFLTSYIPIIGAWTAGIFVFAIALATQGTTAALIMAAVVFLSNGPLQQIVQPVVYGAALRLNPLVVFSVTIAAGTLFGVAGMVLAAPLISAGVQVHRDLTQGTSEEAVGTGTRAPPAVVGGVDGA
jgi:predicted PurR-regulated permease PerM